MIQLKIANYVICIKIGPRWSHETEIPMLALFLYENDLEKMKTSNDYHLYEQLESF